MLLCWEGLIQLPAFSAITGQQTDRMELSADHPVGVAVGITFCSCMPKRIVLIVMLCCVAPAVFSELFDFEHCSRAADVNTLNDFLLRFSNPLKGVVIGSF